jgi:hypothetical protein
VSGKTDTRKHTFTVTMTGEEWDALLGGKDRRYAERIGGAGTAARRKVKDAVGDPAPRRAAALAEVEATLPRLDGDNKRRITAEAKRLHREFLDGSLNVDHLGHADSAKIGRGFEVRLIPAIHGGGSAFHFAMHPQIRFEGEAFGMKAEDRDWFVKLVKRVAGNVEHAWNDSGSWVSVSFVPRTRRRRG